MAIFILLLLAAAFAHFIYDGIIAPSLRCKLRNDLFALRDELRSAQMQSGDASSAAAFDVVHAGINAYLNRLQSVTVSLRARFYQLNREDAAFKRELRERTAILDQANNAELVRIMKRANETIEQAFLTNSAMLVVYSLPLALALAPLFKLHKWAQALVAMKPSETDRLIPRQAESLALAV